VLPAEVSVLYGKLSAQEFEMIKSAGQQLDQGIGDEPALQALKSMDGPLFTRVVQSRDAISQKVKNWKIILLAWKRIYAKAKLRRFNENLLIK
jgi:hypothetical protein